MTPTLTTGTVQKRIFHDDLEVQGQHHVMSLGPFITADRVQDASDASSPQVDSSPEHTIQTWSP